MSHWKWNLVFGVACWALWRDRNLLVFSYQSNIGEVLWSSVCNQAHFIANNLEKPMMSRDQFTTSSQSAWTKPPPRQIKLNIDGAYGRRGYTTCGGLLRDSDGAFTKGFFCKVSYGNALWAEMWSILYGLKLARNLSLQRIIVETDSKLQWKQFQLGSPQILLSECCQMISSSSSTEAIGLQRSSMFSEQPKVCRCSCSEKASRAPSSFR